MNQFIQASVRGMASGFGVMVGITAIGLAATFGSDARAAENLIVNGSFENASLSAQSGWTLRAGSTDIDAWTVFGGNVIWGGAGVPYPGVASDGTSFVDLSSSFGAGVKQDVRTLAGTAYRVSFELGQPGYTPDAAVLFVQTGAGSASGKFSVGNHTSAQHYERFALDFIATGSKTTLWFSSGGGQAVDLDNVVLTTLSAVPEPSTWALAIAGLVLIGSKLIRRSRQV